jgi:hypothetical protein
MRPVARLARSTCPEAVEGERGEGAEGPWDLGACRRLGAVNRFVDLAWLVACFRIEKEREGGREARSWTLEAREPVAGFRVEGVPLMLFFGMAGSESNGIPAP